MKRLYKINSARLWRIGNAENLSPTIDTCVEVAGTKFWLEIMPDLAALGVKPQEGKTAEQVWREGAAQDWAVVDTVVIDDAELEADIRLYDWQDGRLVLNTTRQTVEMKQVKARACAAVRAQLEAELAAEDYKVIKCAEAQAAGAEMPYDVAALHAARQAKREQINEIEAQIAVLQEAGV